MPTIMKLLHIIAAFWFIGGVLGRTITTWRASNSTDVQSVKTLMGLAGYFDRGMVIPGSFAVLGFGLITAWAQNWPLLNAPAGLHIYWLWLSTLLFLSMIPVIGMIFVPRGKVFANTLAMAITQNSVTPDLRAAFHDRAVKYAHIYEGAITIIIIILMVAKPF